MATQQYNRVFPGGVTQARPSVAKQRQAFLHFFIRDHFTITTWLCIGAAIQVALIALPIRTIYSSSPAILLLTWQVIDHFLMAFGIKRNIYMDDVIQTKYAALLPDDEGNFTRSSVGKGIGSGGKKVCIFILGFRINHPLGVLAPGAREIMDYFQQMLDELHKEAATNGFLGNNSFFNIGHRSTNPEISTKFYFNSLDDTLTFAHGPLHRKGWDFYNKIYKKYPHLGISHEVYEAPAGNWENVYVNQHATGLATISRPIKAENGQIMWADSIAEARKGRLASTAGRLGRDLPQDSDE